MSDPRERFSDGEEALYAFMQGFMKEVWTAIPCVVESVNLEAETCELQPSIQGKVTDKTGAFSFVNLPLLLDCPLFFPSGGGFSLTFPVAAGDEALVIFAQRCIDAWWQNGGVQPPAEYRMHDPSDGFALVGFRSQPRANRNISASNVELRSDDNLTSISMGPGNITIECDTLVLRGRTKTVIDSGGTGVVYTPSAITSYTEGVTTTVVPPTPPEIAT